MKNTLFPSCLSVVRAVCVCVAFFVSQHTYAQLSIGSYDDFDAKFNRAGKFHNEHLANVINNFEVPEVGNYQAAVNSITNFNKLFYKQNETLYFGAAEPEPETDQNFEDSKEFVNKPAFTQGLLASSGSTSLDGLIAQIADVPVINDANKELLRDFKDAIKQNIEGGISNEDLEAQFVSLANRWSEINSNNESSPSATLTGVVLTIGLKSSEFWQEHAGEMAIVRFENTTQYALVNRGPSASSNPQVWFLHPAALDAAGAIVSSVGSCLVQYGATGHVNGRAVLGSAIVGAVSASTGLVSKVAGWISSLF